MSRWPAVRPKLLILSNPRVRSWWTWHHWRTTLGVTVCTVGKVGQAWSLRLCGCDTHVLTQTQTHAPCWGESSVSFIRLSLLPPASCPSQASVHRKGAKGLDPDHGVMADPVLLAEPARQRTCQTSRDPQGELSLNALMDLEGDKTSSAQPHIVDRKLLGSRVNG